MLGQKEAAQVAIAINQLIQRVNLEAAHGQAHAFDVIRQWHNKVGVVTEGKTDRGLPWLTFEFGLPPQLAGFQVNFGEEVMDDGAFYFCVLGNLRYEGFMLSGFLPAQGIAFDAQAYPGALGEVLGPFKAWVARQRGARVGVAWRAKALRDIFLMTGAVDRSTWGRLKGDKP
jgi:hypothetical protein